MWHMGDSMGWWMVFGVLVMIAFWALVIWAVSNVFQGRPPNGGQPHPNEAMNALDILDRRFAEGHLTTEEYKEKREVLLQGQRDRE